MTYFIIVPATTRDNYDLMAARDTVDAWSKDSNLTEEAVDVIKGIADPNLPCFETELGKRCYVAHCSDGIGDSPDLWADDLDDILETFPELLKSLGVARIYSTGGAYGRAPKNYPGTEKTT